MDKTTEISRKNGTLPDRFWYQLNEQAAQENWLEQKQAMLDECYDIDEEDSIHITSEVKKK